jgi:hypothetical protein
LLDMAERAGIPFATIQAAADALLAAELLEPVLVQPETGQVRAIPGREK